MARLVGINHVALEVGDLDAALALYRRLFDFELRGRSGSMAFIDIGDQFLALGRGPLPAARRRPPLRPRRRRQGGRPRRDRGRGPRAGRHRPPARLPRPVGQPDRDRRLPRHPVRAGRAGQAQARDRGAGEDREGPRGDRRARPRLTLRGVLVRSWAIRPIEDPRRDDIMCRGKGRRPESEGLETRMGRKTWAALALGVAASAMTAAPAGAATVTVTGRRGHPRRDRAGRTAVDPQHGRRRGGRRSPAPSRRTASRSSGPVGMRRRRSTATRSPRPVASTTRATVPTRSR